MRLAPNRGRWPLMASTTFVNRWFVEVADGALWTRPEHCDAAFVAELGGRAVSIQIPIPGGEDLTLEHLVLDVNGTLTHRGQPIVSAVSTLEELSGRLTLHLLSADTFGTAGELAASLGASYRQVATGEDKREYVLALGASTCVAVGNGRNDVPMLCAAALGIAVLGPEGLHRAALNAAEVSTLSIDEALNLLVEPRGLTATLRL